MRILFLFFLFISLTGSGQQSPASVSVVLREAGELARTEKKNILIVFTASWCGWCHRMKNSLEEEALKEIFSKHFIIRYLVTEESDNKKHLQNPGADSLKTQYGGQGQGLPYWLVLTANGKLLADSRLVNAESGKKENTGCPATVKEVAYFLDVLRQTSSITEEQLGLIQKRFRENEQ